MLIRFRPYLFLVLALVSLIPVAVFGIWPQSKALDKEVAEVADRHLLIARHLRHALERYDADVSALFRFLTAEAIEGAQMAETGDILENFHFRHICIARMDSPEVLFNALSHDAPCPAQVPAKLFELFRGLVHDDKMTYSPVLSGPQGQPLLYLLLQVGDYLSIGAIETDYFIELGKSVAFGERGHAAIVDQTGRILAHPLPQWIAERKDISKVAPVQRMIAGQTGVSQFYSPAVKLDMIAGYTVVPGPGWGVMIPQPMAELEAKAREVKLFALGVILLGLLVAAVAAWWLAGVTTRPLADVAQAAEAMKMGQRGLHVPELKGLKPLEVAELAHSFNDMADAVDKAMAAEREAHADFRAIMDASPAAIFLLDGDSRFRLVNRCFEVWFDRKGSEIAGLTPDEVFQPAFASLLSEAVTGVLESAAARDLELPATLSGGEKRELTTHIFAIARAPGEVDGAGVILVDMTEHKMAQAQLRRAQKMEAVGQLTGGIAHDFNNLLAAIQGSAELLSRSAETKDPYTPTILRAAKRGGELTRRLLAFSRQQPLEPKAINLASLVREMSTLLQSSLGETIEIGVVATAELWSAEADPGQMENAVLNLCLNARDAMPGGGRLTIECANAPRQRFDSAEDPTGTQRDYVMLAVSDSGAGMSPDVQERAIEPFFTTKEVGEGSGLGLSMVYGFVKQSDGHLTIHSEAGQGTTISIYLPRAEAPSRIEPRLKESETPRGRGETILVVEDNS